ncbi:hypothetical protein MASR2M117_12800 [Paludibacter sp.]
MKKITSLLFIFLVISFVSNSNAQDDFSKGADYHLIYLDGATKASIPTSSIKKDFTVDDVNNFLYIWNSTYTNATSPGPNWNGEIGEYLTLQVGTVGWSGFGFACDPAGNATKDMSAVNADYTLHLAMKSTNATTHCIIMEGGDGIAARVAVGASSFVDGNNITPVYTNFVRDGKWHLIEIPMTEFFNKGLRYPAPFKGNVFALLSGGTSGVTISLDAIYVYRKVVAGLNNPQSEDLDVIVTSKTLSVVEASESICLFDITGSIIRTSKESIIDIEDIQKGIYIVRCGTKSKKILIK